MWFSKEDVLKDLAQCTGVPMNDFDEDFIVRGTRPPPPPIRTDIEEDVQFQLRFSGCGDNVPMYENPAPNLPGITEMIRMVDKYNKPPEAYSPQHNYPSPRSKEARQMIVISKPHNTNQNRKQTVNSQLNPNVKEFIPKTLTTGEQVMYKNNNNRISLEPETNINNVINAQPVLNCNDSYVRSEKLEKLEINDTTAANMTTATNTDSATNSLTLLDCNDSDGSSESSEKQKLIALLKSKISASSKEQSLEKKLEKNVAMAALLRLNTRPPALNATVCSTSSNSTPKCVSPLINSVKPYNSEEIPNTTPLVLMTPDDFAGPIRSPTVLEVEDNEHKEAKPLYETPRNTPSPKQVNDPYIKESIDKVNNWLSSPGKKAKAKSTVLLQMGPQVFRKKDSVSPRSLCSEVGKKAEPVPVIPSYVPSKYADELARDLEARVKAKKDEELENQPRLDMWTKLEMDLKARDKISKDRLNSPEDRNSSQSNSPRQHANSHNKTDGH